MQYDALRTLHLDAPTRVLVSRLLRDHLRPQARRIAIAGVCMVLSAASTVAFAKLIEPILDRVFNGGLESMIVPLGVAIAAVGFIRGLAAYGQRLYLAKAAITIIRDLQHKVFRHLLGSDLALFQANSTGQLIARVQTDVELLRQAMAETFMGLGRDVLTLCGLFTLMFFQDWVLAMVALVSFPLAGRAIFVIGRWTRRLTRERQAELGRFTTVLDEAFRGARVIKAYNLEDHEAKRARSVLHRLVTLGIRQEAIRAISYPVLEAIGGIAIGAVVIYGGYQVIDGTRSAGTFFSFLVALALCYEPIRRLSQINARMQSGLAAAERVFALLDLEPAIVDRPEAKPLVLDGGEIRLAAVDFGYHEEEPVLHDLSLVVPAGRTVAIVGPSGAGKSTIINLIPRFYDVQSGAITVDGQDVREVTLESLRAAVGLVAQESSLFDDTVKANIAYGRPEASDEEIVEAARRAGAHDFIMELPQGYETPVGGRGERVSGGQRQRIAIARAFLKNAPILLLDEATSALDAGAERRIQTALRELMRGRTTLIVAHRLSTVINADIIYVIDDGRIVESGSHAELLARDGLYAGLYALQAADDTPADEERRASA